MRELCSNLVELERLDAGLEGREVARLNAFLMQMLEQRADETVRFPDGACVKLEPKEASAASATINEATVFGQLVNIDSFEGMSCQETFDLLTRREGEARKVMKPVAFCEDAHADEAIDAVYRQLQTAKERVAAMRRDRKELAKRCKEQQQELVEAGASGVHSVAVGDKRVVLHFRRKTSRRIGAKELKTVLVSVIQQVLSESRDDRANVVFEIQRRYRLAKLAATSEEETCMMHHVIVHA